MKTDIAKSVAGTRLKNKIRRFYDSGSQYYLDLLGEHLHDGYYLTGTEFRREAQEDLTRLLAEKAQIKEGSRVLDVGCGVGGSSIWLAKHCGALMTGITISPVQVGIAAKLAAEQQVNASFRLMDAEEMDFVEPFDVIWVVAALTHFRGQENFINNAVKFLKPAGKLVIYDWTLAEGSADSTSDMDIKRVKAGMVLSSLYPGTIYLSWLKKYGCRIAYAEDLTGHTARTWDDLLSLAKEPANLKLAWSIARKDGFHMVTFLRGVRAMKRAMEAGKIRSWGVVGERD